MAPRHGSSTSSTKTRATRTDRVVRLGAGCAAAAVPSSEPPTNGQPAAQMMPVDENGRQHDERDAPWPCVAFSAVLAPCAATSACMLRNPGSRASPCLESRRRRSTPSCITLRPARFESICSAPSAIQSFAKETPSFSCHAAMSTLCATCTQLLVELVVADLSCLLSQSVRTAGIRFDALEPIAPERARGDRASRGRRARPRTPTA